MKQLKTMQDMVDHYLDRIGYESMFDALRAALLRRLGFKEVVGWDKVEARIAELEACEKLADKVRARQALACLEGSDE